MAATLDWITLAEGTAALNLSGTDATRDARVAYYITAVSHRLDSAVGAAVTRTVTAEEHDGGQPVIVLRHPATAITTVTEYQGTTGVVLTAETPGVVGTYKAERDPQNTGLFTGQIWRRSGGYDYQWYWGRGNITVTYTAGRVADTASVWPRFKMAAELMLGNLWAVEEPTVTQQGDYTVPGGRFPTFAVPKVVRELLRDEWRETHGLA